MEIFYKYVELGKKELNSKVISYYIYHLIVSTVNSISREDFFKNKNNLVDLALTHLDIRDKKQISIKIKEQAEEYNKKDLEIKETNSDLLGLKKIKDELKEEFNEVKNEVKEKNCIIKNI
jgi:hypothetical protein